MNQRQLWTICIVMTGCLLCSSILRRDKSSIQVPKGWPKPTYTFLNNSLSEAGFSLGRKLFYDPILSRNATISCADCHTQYSSFTHVDHAVSHGIDGRKGTRNSPVLINLAWNPAFMQDGGINHLEIQPLAPISSPTEMDNSLSQVVRVLSASNKYKTLFTNAFGDSAITGQRVLKALAQFTGSLVSYNAKYDRYIRHEAGATFTHQENQGLQLFRKHCSTCHPEPLFTDHTFRNIGLAVDTELHDEGRKKITGKAEDAQKFKVPTLRNIEVSFPYMHDGRFKTLRQVLKHYTASINQSPTLDEQLRYPMPLSDSERTDIIAFLLTLTDTTLLNNPRFRYHHDD